jgi:chaperonin GroES
MIKPLAHFVVLEPYHEEKKKTAILLPESENKERVEKGKIVAVADAKSDVKKGDVVFFKKYSEQKVNHDGKEYLIVKIEDILAKIN